jgi:hypothetical protein
MLVDIEGEAFNVREAGPSDLGFVFSTWMESAREIRQCRLSVFNTYYPDRVRELLKTEPVHVAERNSTLHGWACGAAPNVLRFAYVPYALRGHGLGRALIEAALGGYPGTVWVTGSPLSLPNHKRFVFNPFL